MQTILHNACLIIICLTVDITESVPADERSPSSFQSTSKNCTTPKPVVDGAILKWQAGRDNSVFLPGEKAEFVCKEGYRQIGWLKTLTCQKDGSWSSQTSIDDDFKPSESVSGYCVTNRCNRTRTFNCTTNKESVDICKRCDCVADCRDGSDEMNCGPILINVTARATGEVKYPETANSRFSGPLRCSRTLWTDEPGFYIKLLFKKFSLPEDCNNNYVFLENATFSDSTSPECCKKNDKVSCGFGAKSGAPPLSHTAKNFMIITLVSKASNFSEFAAKWFHVNGFFPYGVVPKDDVPYPDKLHISKTQSKKTENGVTNSTYVAAVVIFSIFAFVVLAVVACKVGQHFIGPQCSVGYCCAWIAAKRRQRSLPRVPSPEVTPIRGEIYDEPTQGRTQRSAHINDGPSLRTRYGSAGEIA